MNGTHNELRTGILALVTLGVLMIMLIYLGAPELLSRMNHYQVYFDNAGGIEIGAPVMLGGRRVGQVSRIISPVPEPDRPRPNMESIVDVAVDCRAKIYSNARATMLQYGLLGEQVIDFTGGSESALLATAETKFVGERQPGLNDAAAKLIEKLDPVIASATKALEEIERTASQVTRLTAENSDLTKSLHNFKDLSANLVELSGSDGSVQKTLCNLKELTGKNGAVQRTVDNLEGLTGNDSDLALTLRNAKDFSGSLANNKDIEKSIHNFRRATERVNSTIQTIRPTLKATMHNAEQFTDTVKREPWRLIWPSTKKYPTPTPTPSVVAERKRKAVIQTVTTTKVKCVTPVR